MKQEVEYYEDTRIQKGRIYGKGELAICMGIGRSTMSRILQGLETRLADAGAYQKYQKTLSPLQVKVVLGHLGFI